MPKTKKSSTEAAYLKQLGKAKAPATKAKKKRASKAPAHAKPAIKRSKGRDPGKTVSLWLYDDETAMVDKALLTLLSEDGIRSNQSQILRAGLHVAFSSPANIKALRKQVRDLKSEQDLRFK